MKLFFGLAVFLWLFCGFLGAWILEGREDLHLKTIAKGPITLIKAVNEDPVTVPMR